MCQQSFILKKVSLRGNWWLPAPDRATGYLSEAAELMHAHFLMERFLALDRGTESFICRRSLLFNFFRITDPHYFITAIRFAPTFIFYNQHYTLGLVQPAISGTQFTRQSLVDQGNKLAVDTLDAFEHFIFDATRGIKVMTDFQGRSYSCHALGLRTDLSSVGIVERDGTLCIFDGYMHSM